jgi:hypothetical protein
VTLRRTQDITGFEMVEAQSTRLGHAGFATKAEVTALRQYHDRHPYSTQCIGAAGKVYVGDNCAR